VPSACRSIAGINPLASPAEPIKIFLIAGEPSGDRLGAALMTALRGETSVTFCGVGGSAMEGEGLKSLFPLADIAVMGIVSVLARLPLLRARIKETADAVVAQTPDILLIIDSPDFTHRVARFVRKRRPDLLIVDYVSPTVWAWRPQRAKHMRATIDHVMALLPFEPEAYRRLDGPACTYVGHPLIEHLERLTPSPAEAAERETSPPLILLLPGSRRSEIKHLLAVFRAALTLLREKFGPMHVALPTVPPVRALVEAGVADWDLKPEIILGDEAKYAAFRRAHCALAASGTVTLELALAGVPQCVGYKVAWAESFLRFLVKVPSIVLPNLILGRNAVPEFLQERCTPQALCDAMFGLLTEPALRKTQTDASEELRALMLHGPQSEKAALAPSQSAARLVLDLYWKRQAH